MIKIEPPVEVKAARALGSNGGWALSGDYTYDDLICMKMKPVFLNLPKQSGTQK